MASASDIGDHRSWYAHTVTIPWPLPQSPELRDQLLAAWNSPQRAYHTMTHLAEMIQALDRLLVSYPQLQQDRDVLYLAAWFHDAVYEGERDDEERSAQWASDALQELSYPRWEEVVALIEATRDHEAVDGDLLTAVFCDSDLAILGSHIDRYREYAVAVEREYNHLPPDLWRAGRTAVLDHMLDKRTIYQTNAGQSFWESQARSNMIEEQKYLA